MPRKQNSRQIHNININNKCIETVAELKYLGKTVTNENDIYECIKSRLNSGKAWSHYFTIFSLPTFI